jgi:hypothetical protein
MFWGPHLHRKFQLQNFWSCALVWWCQKHHLTKHIFPPPLTNNFSLNTTCSSHETFLLCHLHGLRQTNLCWVLFSSTNMRHFQNIIHEDESRISIWNLISCHIICVSSLITWFVNFDATMFVFLGYVFSENDPPFEQNNHFIYSQMFGRAVKFWKCLV